MGTVLGNGEEMRMGKFTKFELLQIKFWLTMLKCMGVLVAHASGANPRWESFDSAMKKIESTLVEIEEAMK